MLVADKIGHCEEDEQVVSVGIAGRVKPPNDTDTTSFVETHGCPEQALLNVDRWSKIGFGDLMAINLESYCCAVSV